jgi:hypothetical protein
VAEPVGKADQESVTVPETKPEADLKTDAKSNVKTDAKSAGDKPSAEKSE